MNRPEDIKITVATVTYNAEAMLEPTLHSVEEQTHRNVEHLIVDGNSGDNTLELVREYLERNGAEAERHEIILVSEPDEGLYDAMNKALRKATGHYIVYMNAGDTFHSADTLETVARCAFEKRISNARPQEPGLPAVVYGQTDVVDEEGHYLRPRHLTAPARLTWRSFQRGMLVCHQAFFARTDLAQQCPYDQRYHFSADFDWCVRIMRLAARKKLPLVYTGATLADFMDGGMTTKNHSLSLRERFRIMTRHYGWLPTVVWHGWFLMRRLFKRKK